MIPNLRKKSGYLLNLNRLIKNSIEDITEEQRVPKIGKAIFYSRNFNNFEIAFSGRQADFTTFNDEQMSFS